MIGRRFHPTCTTQRACKLLVRERLALPGSGSPRGRAGRRRRHRVSQGGVTPRGGLAAARCASLVFEDEAGFSMRPPQPGDLDRVRPVSAFEADPADASQSAP